MTAGSRDQPGSTMLRAPPDEPAVEWLTRTRGAQRSRRFIVVAGLLIATGLLLARYGAEGRQGIFDQGLVVSHDALPAEWGLPPGWGVLPRPTHDQRHPDEEPVAVVPPPAPPARAAESADSASREPVGVWRELPASPLPPGRVAAHAWTGEDLIVWRADHGTDGPDATGGTDGDHPTNAAAYNAQDGDWRVLAPVPLKAGARTGAVWTGDRLLAMGAAPGADTGAGSNAAAAYDPAASDDWRLLPPVPEGTWEWGEAVWNGQSVVVVGTTVADAGGPEPAAMSYDPGRQTWSPLPPPPLSPHQGRIQVRALGERVVVAGAVSDVRTGKHSVLTAYDPRSGEWSDAEAMPFEGLWSVAMAAHTPSDSVVFVGAVQDDQGWYDVTGSWAPGSGFVWTAVDDRRAWGQHYPQVLSTPHGLLTWAPGTRNGWLLTEGTPQWKPLPSTVGWRDHTALAWTGDELLIWGGTSQFTREDNGAAWSPS